MTPERTPLILHAWFLGTWLFAYPIAALSRYFHRRMGADPKRFPERLGRRGPDSPGDFIWFHAASLGEVIQIGPLASELVRTKQLNILITTTTAAGADWVAEKMPYAHHRFAPLDTPAAIRRFLDAWPISVAIFIEGDLWPRLVKTLQKRGIPQALLNARHSRTRLRFPTAFSSLLASFQLVTCRSQAIAGEMRGMGVREAGVRVLPDLRLTLPRLMADQALIDPLADALADRPLWLAASTHSTDELAVLKAHIEVLKTNPETLLVIAPRHPRRADQIKKIAHDQGLKIAQRSINEGISADIQVYLADTLGELGIFYTLSPIAFLGGSFGTEGGHNPYEPASFNTALLYGPNVKNFSAAYKALTQAGAALQAQHPSKLGPILTDLIKADKVEKMAKAGAAFMNEAQGSLSTYSTLVLGILEKSER